MGRELRTDGSDRLDRGEGAENRISAPQRLPFQKLAMRLAYLLRPASQDSDALPFDPSQFTLFHLCV